MGRAFRWQGQPQQAQRGDRARCWEVDGRVLESKGRQAGRWGAPGGREELSLQHEVWGPCENMGILSRMQEERLTLQVMTEGDTPLSFYFRKNTLASKHEGKFEKDRFIQQIPRYCSLETQK